MSRLRQRSVSTTPVEDTIRIIIGDTEYTVKYSIKGRRNIQSRSQSQSQSEPPQLMTNTDGLVDKTKAIIQHLYIRHNQIISDIPKAENIPAKRDRLEEIYTYLTELEQAGRVLYSAKMGGKFDQTDQADYEKLESIFRFLRGMLLNEEGDEKFTKKDIQDNDLDNVLTQFNNVLNPLQTTMGTSGTSGGRPKPPTRDPSKPSPGKLTTSAPKPRAAKNKK